MPRLLPAIVAVLLLGPWFGCDEYPKDPQGTLDGVRGGVMRVGVSEAEPWAWREGGEAAGVEADLARELAAELGARVEWVWGSPEEHLAALESWQLDLVIGGLTQGSPWTKRIGASRPFARYAIVVGLPPGVEAPGGFEGAQIAVPWGSPLATHVKDIGADAVATRDWWRAAPALQTPAAAPEWALSAWGMTSSGVELTEQKHIVAVPPGENAWLVYVERFLHDRETDIPRRLSAAATALAERQGPAPATQPATAPAGVEP